MSNLNIDKKNGVAVLTLKRGMTNAINLDFVKEIRQALVQLKADGGIKGLVLTGNDRYFSMGFDVPEFYEAPREDFAKFYRAFNELCAMLYTIGIPSIAAVTGHATAGGCILALCCDQRFVKDGKLIGLNESRLGLPVPHLTELMLVDQVGEERAKTIIDTGKFYRSNAIMKVGIAERVYNKRPVMEAALETVQEWVAKPPKEREGMAERRRAIVEHYLEERDDTEPLLIDAWFKEENRKALAEAKLKFEEYRLE